MTKVIKTSAVSGPKPSSKGQEARLQRQAVEIIKGKEALAAELAKTLVMRPHKGNCRCGLMLTERDRNPKSGNYLCPRCGKSGRLAPA